MKKIILAMVLSVMAFAVSAKRWDNYVNTGVRFPANTLKIEAEKSSEDCKITPVAGFDAGYTGVLDNGFSLKGTFTACYVESDMGSEDDTFSGSSVEFLLGAGYAPVHTNNMLLGFYTLFGMGYTGFYHSMEGPGFKTEETRDFNNMIAGLNGTFVYTFTKTFSVYASVTLEHLFNGKYEYESKTNDKADSSINCDLKDSFLVVPCAGFSWKF